MSPFEADQQIAYLAANDCVDCIISDDSDTVMCDIDVIRNFTIKNRQIRGDLIKYQDMTLLYQKYESKQKLQ